MAIHPHIRQHNTPERIIHFHSNLKETAEFLVRQNEYPHFDARGRGPGLPQNMNVPRLVEVTMSMAPSLFRSTASTVDPTPERLWINSGMNSAPPGALGLRTVLNQ